MKQFFFSFGLLVSLSATAQQLKVNTGQKIIISSTIVQDIDMGVGQMKNSSNSVSTLEIKNTDEKNIGAVYKLEKLKISMDAMGQQQDYDSEKATDKETEMGKGLAGKVGHPVNVIIDKRSGKAEAEKSAQSEDKGADENPMAGVAEMFGAAETEAAIAESAILLIPSGKKTGDSWTDSLSVKDGMKGYRTYTIKDVQGDETTIAMVSKIEGTNNVEMQGMEIDVTISAKTEGELIINNKTSLVKKSNRVADISGNMNLMGQSMPITSKMTETTVYN